MADIQSTTTCHQDHPKGRRLIRARQACAILGVSKSTWHAKVREGLFPQPVVISEGCRGWVEDEVYGLVDRLIAARGQA